MLLLKYILFHIYFDNNSNKPVGFQLPHILIQPMVCHTQNNRNVEHDKSALQQSYTPSKILTGKKKLNNLTSK